MEDVVPACHVPENNVRNHVPVHPVGLLHHLIEGPVAVAAIVDFHIGNDDQGLGHFLLRNMVPDGNVQHMFEGGAQIGAAGPVVHVNTVNLLRQCLSAEQLDPGSAGEGHEHVVISAPVALRKIDCEAYGRRHRSACHRAGGIRNDNGVCTRLHIIRKPTPLGFQGRVRIQSGSRIKAEPQSRSHFLHNVVGIQGTRMDRFLTGHRALHELRKALAVMPAEGIAVDHHGAGRNLRIPDLLPASL